VLTGLGGGPPPLHAASANASKTSAMYPLPPRTTLARLGFARALAPRADLKDLRIRTLITSPPDVAAPRGFPVNLPSRFLLVTSIRTQRMVTASSRADVLSRYLFHPVYHATRTRADDDALQPWAVLTDG